MLSFLQVVGCVIQSCDASTYPPKLSLSLDVAGKTEQIDGAAAAEQVKKSEGGT